MVVCSCRNIRESQYPTREELIARVLQDDYNCTADSGFYMFND